MNEPLPPCPFCGGETHIDARDYFGRPIPSCRQCGAEAPSIEKWNRRTAPPATAHVWAFIDACLNVAGVAEVTITEETARLFHAEWSAPPAPVLDEHRASSPGTTGEATCEGLSDD